MHVIRETKSICPVCLDPIEAFVVEKGDKMLLTKKCVLHGNFEILLSGYPEYYKKLETFYFSVMNGENKLREYEFWPTLRCNMECQICCFKGSKGFLEELEPGCKEIENFIKDSRVNFYTISGGEATCREDLDQIIGIFTRHRKTVTMNTNGLKLGDLKYLIKLRDAGLKRVNLQFDGFERESYQALRGSDVLDAKLKTLENLRILNMPTVLNATIAKNLNEGAVLKLIDYANKNDFINGVTFFTLCYIGGARDWPLNNYIMPDEVVDILGKQANCGVTRRNVFLLQKLHLAIKSFLSQKSCLYNSIYVFVRGGKSYEPIEKFLNLNNTEPWLAKYSRACNKSRFLSGVYLFMAIMSSLAAFRSYEIIREIIVMGLSYFFKTRHYLKSKKFFYVSFSTGCDPYKIDYSIVKNCQNETIAVNKKSGKLGCEGRVCLYSIELEKEHLSMRHNNG